MTLEVAYQKLIRDKVWLENNEQLVVVKYLDQMLVNISRMVRFRPKLGGVYLWGGVGTGKSAIMQLLYDNIKTKRKVYWSCAQLLQLSHSKIVGIRHKKPLYVLAKYLSKKYKIICLDEFEINDISEVMLLGRLINELIKLKVVLVFTSNTPIHKLYLNGLQRRNLEPTLELMQGYLSELQLHGIDYRLGKPSLGLYYINAEYNCLNKIFDKYNQAINHDNEFISCPWPLPPKPMKVVKRNNGIIWVDFESLCGVGRCIADYQLLATQIECIIIANVPRFNKYALDSLTNFIGLVDVLYSSKVQLVISAEVELSELCTDGRLLEKFKRTKSRLQAMTVLQAL